MRPPLPLRLNPAPPSDKSVGGLLQGLSVLTGFPFRPVTSLAIGSANINPSTPSVMTDPLNASEFLGLKTDSITKFDPRGKKGTISAQINIATNSYVYDRLRAMRQRGSKSDIDRAFSSFEKELERCMGFVDLSHLPENMRIFLRETIRTLSQSAAIPAIQYVEKAKAEIFEELKASSQHHQSRNKYAKGAGKGYFERAADIRSHVKDVDGIWLKDTLFSFALGLLHTPEEYRQVVGILTRLNEHKGAIRIPGILLLPTTQSELSPTMFYQEKLGESIELLIRYFTPYTRQVHDVYSLDDVPIPFGGHVPGLPGARHDTLIHPDKVNRIPPFHYTRLHVAEIRSDGVERLVELTHHLYPLIDAVDTNPLKTLNDQIRLQSQLKAFVDDKVYTLGDIAWALNKNVDQIQRFLNCDFPAKKSSHRTSAASAAAPAAPAASAPAPSVSASPAPSVSPSVSPKRDEPAHSSPPHTKPCHHPAKAPSNRQAKFR